MRLSPAPVRSRMRGARTATGPRPVMIARSGRWPWRTSRWRPSSVCLSAWPLRKAATSASTACASSARAPSRRTSVSGSENSAGWISLTTLSWIMAYHSFGGEVEARTPPRYAASTPHAVTNFHAYLSGEGKALEQQRDGGDLIRLGVGGFLPEHQALTGRPGGDEMQRLAALAAVVRAPRSLAVDGDNIGLGVAQLVDPGHKAGLEERGVERVDDVVKGIMGGKAIVERQK